MAKLSMSAKFAMADAYASMVDKKMDIASFANLLNNYLWFAFSLFQFFFHLQQISTMYYLKLRYNRAKLLKIVLKI